MEQLAELHDVKSLTTAVEDKKTQIISLSLDKEKKDVLLSEMVTERKVLEQERDSLLQLLSSVQMDLEEIIEAERVLMTSRDGLAKRIEGMREKDFEPLRQATDKLRLKHGLKPVSSLQDDLDREMFRLLSEHRERWRDTGIISEESPGASPRAEQSPQTATRGASSNGTEKRGRKKARH
ncbi:hypothetical protein BC829DRAFT_382689 [Chytridium lagenaria]|nr:hypothetical protein BC829DRAFT_382689 [Chytridium lagenaria]